MRDVFGDRWRKKILEEDNSLSFTCVPSLQPNWLLEGMRYATFLGATGYYLFCIECLNRKLQCLSSIFSLTTLNKKTRL